MESKRTYFFVLTYSYFLQRFYCATLKNNRRIWPVMFKTEMAVHAKLVLTSASTTHHRALGEFSFLHSPNGVMACFFRRTTLVRRCHCIVLLFEVSFE